MDDGDGARTITQQSGISRLGQSLFCAFCIAPLMLLGSGYLIGTNERVAVCQSRAISAASDSVTEVRCDQTGSENLVMFHCDMSEDTPSPTYAWKNFDKLAAFLPAFNYHGSGLEVSVEMLQCVETSHQEKEKDRIGGGESTVTTYTYHREWVSGPVDSGDFHSMHKALQSCGAHNPAWPAGVPEGTVTTYAPYVKVGSFTLEGEMVEWIPLDTYADVSSPVGKGWKAHGTGRWHNDELLDTVYSSMPANSRPSSNGIGSMKVTVKGSNTNNPRLTVLGHEHNGIVRRWIAPDSWLCSGFNIAELRSGNVDKAQLFKGMQQAASALLIILRIVGFGLMWLSFMIMASPLGIMADCIPICGPCLGDVVDALACAASCVPATSCFMLIAGVVWVVMRPMVGGPLLLMGLAGVGGLVFAKMHRHSEEESGGGAAPLVNAE